MRYTADQMYEAHWDYFNPAQYQQQPEVIEHMDLTKRNRMATLFWYLNSVPEGSGGQTFFPRAVNDKVFLPWPIRPPSAAQPPACGQRPTTECCRLLFLRQTGESITKWKRNYKDCNQGIKYPPVRGNAVLFYSMRPVRHSALPRRPATLCNPATATGLCKKGTRVGEENKRPDGQREAASTADYTNNRSKDPHPLSAPQRLPGRPA